MDTLSERSDGSGAGSANKEYHAFEVEDGFSGISRHATIASFEKSMGRKATLPEKERWQQINAQGGTLHVVDTADFAQQPVRSHDIH